MDVSPSSGKAFCMFFFFFFLLFKFLITNILPSRSLIGAPQIENGGNDVPPQDEDMNLTSQALMSRLNDSYSSSVPTTNSIPTTNSVPTTNSDVAHDTRAADPDDVLDRSSSRTESARDRARKARAERARKNLAIPTPRTRKKLAASTPHTPRKNPATSTPPAPRTRRPCPSYTSSDSEDTGDNSSASTNHPAPARRPAPTKRSAPSKRPPSNSSVHMDNLGSIDHPIDVDEVASYFEPMVTKDYVWKLLLIYSSYT